MVKKTLSKVKEIITLKDFQDGVEKQVDKSYTKDNSHSIGIQSLVSNGDEMYSMYKMMVFPDFELDINKTKEHVGNILHSLAQVCYALDLDLEDIMSQNHEKRIELYGKKEME